MHVLCDLAELLFLCHSSLVYKVGPMEVTFKDYVLTSSVALLLCCVLEAFVTNILYCIYLGNREESNGTPKVSPLPSHPHTVGDLLFLGAASGFFTYLPS